MSEGLHNGIRELDPTSRAEVELVAARMRQTLIEVLGEERGGEMYTMEWLVNRVLWHLDPANCVGQVFLSEGEGAQVTGHTIVRIEKDDMDGEFGLFSTFYVEPGSRNKSVAKRFVEHGEKWMRDRGMTTAKTYTAVDNSKLRNLMEGLGYKVVLTKNDMVVLSKEL